MTASSTSRYIAIALVAAAIILLEIAATRLLSVVLWYHWAFFSISVAMLGVGAPGVWISLARPRVSRLPPLLLAAAVLVPAGVCGIVRASQYFAPAPIVFCMLCLLAPMLTMGAALCLLLLEVPGVAIGRRYAFDLLGGCLGALAIIPLLWLIPTPQLAGMLGLLPLVAYLLVGGSKRTGMLVALTLLALLLWSEPFSLRHSKSYAEQGPRTTPIHERWTPTARLTVFDNIFFAEQGEPFGWGMGRRPVGVSAPEQYWLEQDGSAGTPITRFDGDLTKVRYLLNDVTTAGYQWCSPAKVAIVGAGGGRDILVALLTGATEIDAIELNAGIVEALRGPFAEFSGFIYDHPRVNTIVREGRSALTQSRRSYDLIQISLTDSWAATAAGSYSLSENNLYTVEAYRLYWSRLSARGVVATSRWMLGGFGLEVPRLLLLVKAALQAEKVASPADHVALLQGGAVGTVLMTRAPLDTATIESLRRIARLRGFTLHLPATDLAPEQQWMRQVLEVGPVLHQRWGVILDPPTDDRPFFFQVLSPLRPIRPAVALHAGHNAQGVASLQQLMLLMGCLTLVLFFAPFPLARWLHPEPGLWRGSCFFVGIGLAFMFVEMAWLQRLILYLGHPSLATTVALGCILLGAGAGSLQSARLGLGRVQRLVWLTAPCVLLSNAALGPVFANTLGWPWTLRLGVALAVLVPTGLLMGLFFPMGMVRFGEANRAWFWALNGAAAVLASVVSLALAMEFGFTKVGYLGGAIYLVTALALRGQPPHRWAGQGRKT